MFSFLIFFSAIKYTHFFSFLTTTRFHNCFRLELYLTFLFTALSINMEKNSGLIERSLASGTNTNTFYLSRS